MRIRVWVWDLLLVCCGDSARLTLHLTPHLTPYLTTYLTLPVPEPPLTIYTNCYVLPLLLVVRSTRVLPLLVVGGGRFTLRTHTLSLLIGARSLQMYESRR